MSAPSSGDHNASSGTLNRILAYFGHFRAEEEDNKPSGHAGDTAATRHPNASTTHGRLVCEHSMESIAKHTMHGAEFDSSARNPPPLCYPGTRKIIIKRVQRWLHGTNRQKRILWLVGLAGVGKSAIMQSLAELTAASFTLKLGATLFFSRLDGRNNSSLVFFTLAYQIALKYPSYRKFVLQEITSDPELPTRAMSTQFTRLIVIPFAVQKISRMPGALLVFLDGIDECEGDHAQCEIIDLISSFCLTYPNAPLVWVISSRPEAHLLAVFSRPNIVPSWEKEEVPIDSDDACADVRHYLGKEFERIQRSDPIARDRPEWPSDEEFGSISYAAGGLFAYASSVIGFVGDPAGDTNPVSRLEQFVAGTYRSSSVASEPRVHPLARLDALYTCILSEIPEDVQPNTIILLTGNLVLGGKSLCFLCNWVGMTLQNAYHALHRLHSVLNIPPPERAEQDGLEYYHRSFGEYLKDPDRSRAFHISKVAMDKLEFEKSVRILKEVHSDTVADAETTAPQVSKPVLVSSTADSEAIQESLHCAAAACLRERLIYNPDPGFALPMLQDPGIIQILRACDLFEQSHHRRRSVKGIFDSFPGVRPRLDPRIRIELQKLKLLQVVPVGTLNLENVGEEKYTYALCESHDHDRSACDPRGILSTSNYTCMVCHDTGYQVMWASDPHHYSGRLEPILHDLRSAQVQSPNTPVLLFGNAICAYFMYKFKTPDLSQRWTYYVPYRLS